MPVHLQLSDDQRYLIYTITEPLSLDELMLAYQQERVYRDSLPYTVHSIVDMSGIKRIPANWLTAKAGPGLTHPRSGEILFVGVSFGIKIILDTLMKITRYQRMKFFQTRAEADAYMAELLKRTSPASVS
ncbi:MAG: hypothetical protein HZC41_00305 [Chloroflexi bacterium]|nr:hypothetical protein [Chloroflexota bacterium]